MKQVRFALVILFFWTVVPGGFSQGVIQGKVFDGSTGNPLQGANVILKRNLGTITGSDGFYRVSVPPGNITLSFQYTGYATVTRTLRVADHDTLLLDTGMEDEVSEIDQVVVSAGRIEQRIAELSVSMSLIKPSALAQNHITDTKELINKTSGIEVLDGQASIRGGSGFSYGAGSRVLAMIDGLPVMAADAGNVRWQFLPLENVSQIEIIKGAASVAYGSSALNGVINFRTADAGVKPVTCFYAESGIYDSPRNDHWKWWDTPRIFATASVSHLQRFGNTGLGFGANLVTDKGYRRLNDNRLGRMNLKVKHDHKNIAGLSYGLSFNGGLTDKTDFVLWENATTGALKNSESTAIGLKSHFFTLDPFISFHNEGSTGHDFRARWQSSVNDYPESSQNNSSASNFYAEYQYSHRFSDIVSINSGLSENYSWISSNFYGDHHGLNAGAFTQLDVNATSRMRFTSGVRFEQNWLDNEHDKIVPLFRAGFNFRAFDYTFLRASFGQGYRYPSVAEKFASTTLGSVRIFPSLSIQPEKGWNAEVGVKQGIGSKYFSGLADIALFYSQHTDMIEFIFSNYPDPQTGVYSLGFKADNTEAARVYGLELEYMVTKKVGRLNNTITGGYVFMYPVEFSRGTGENTGVMLKYRRKHSATLNFLGNYDNLEFGLGLYLRSKIMHIDDVFLNPTTREALLPGFYDYWTSHRNGYFLADANVGYNLGAHYKVSVMIKNLTNAEYMGRPGDIQPQRSYSLRLAGSF